MEGKLAYIWYWMDCLKARSIVVYFINFWQSLTVLEPMYYRLAGYYPAILLYQVNQYKEFSIM